MHLFLDIGAGSGLVGRRTSKLNDFSSNNADCHITQAIVKISAENKEKLLALD
jgi:hypothetical protein